LLISEHNEGYVAGHLFLGITEPLSMTFLNEKVYFNIHIFYIGMGIALYILL